MALTRNGSNQLAGLSRFHGAVGAYGLRSALDNNGKCKNFDSGQHSVSSVTNKAAIPDGFRHPMSWKMGTKTGSLSSHVEAGITFSPTGAMLMGYPIDGSTSFTITTNIPDGQLIVSGTGSATLLIDTNNPLLTASVNGTGSTSFTVETNIPILGAEASLIGECSLTVTTNNPTILPENDSSPLRDATASFTFTGTLQSYALGIMEGSTEGGGGLTVNAITDSIWNAILANYTATGTAGKALASAGSGGVDYDALVTAINTDPNTLTIPKFIGLK